MSKRLDKQMKIQLEAESAALQVIESITKELNKRPNDDDHASLVLTFRRHQAEVRMLDTLGHCQVSYRAAILVTKFIDLEFTHRNLSVATFV